MRDRDMQTLAEEVRIHRERLENKLGTYPWSKSQLDGLETLRHECLRMVAAAEAIIEEVET